MCLSTSCIHLVSHVGFPPLASPQLLAFMLFQYPNFSCTPVPLSNFLHAFGFNISASPVSQQLLALIWFQYLTSTRVLLIKLPKLPAFIGFQCLYFPRSLPTTSCVHFVLISKLPPRCPSATSCIHLVLYLVPSWPPKVPPTCASQQVPAFMRSQYLGFPPSSLHSFLHAPSFGFNI